LKHFLFILTLSLAPLLCNAQDKLDLRGSWSLIQTQLDDKDEIFKKICDSIGLDLTGFISKMDSLFVGINFEFQENEVLIITNSPESNSPVKAGYSIHNGNINELEIFDSKIFSGKPYNVYKLGSKLIMVYPEMGGRLLLYLFFEPI
jgi:hypothetical protein